MFELYINDDFILSIDPDLFYNDDIVSIFYKAMQLYIKNKKCFADTSEPVLRFTINAPDWCDDDVNYIGEMLYDNLYNDY